MNQQLTAREWIELIADPEIRKKALANVNNPELTKYDDLELKWGSFTSGLENAFWWRGTPEGERYWQNLADNPPALLPFPNKEREQAEALLKEFTDWFHKTQVANIFIDEGEISDFLNQKYPL